MTKQEIINAVQLNIAGQGSQVDISGKLAGILSEIANGAKFNQQAKITVRVYAYNKDEDAGEWVPDAGATGNVIVKGFTESGETLPVQTLPFTIPTEGDDAFAVVELTANVGDTIGITAKIAEKGASCQFVQKVVGPTTVPVEIYPAGIYEIGDGMLSITPGDDVCNGFAIITEDFALALPTHQRSGYAEEYVQWGGMFQPVPFVLKTDKDTEAIKDFDGALNSAAILSVVGDQKAAARVATDMGDIAFNRVNPFLPSAGMLKYLYDHKAEINAFIAAETEAYKPETDYDQLPNLAFWSSTDYKQENDIAVSAWYVNLYHGHVNRINRSSNGRIVLSVSAFQFTV